MNLISLQNSWNTINNNINFIKEEDNSYLLTKQKLLNNGPVDIFYIDQFDYHTDSLNSLSYWHGNYSNKKIDVVFNNTSVKISAYTFDMTNIKNIIFKFQSNELSNLEISDMLSLARPSHYIIVPEGTKQDYIDKFDNTTDAFNIWGQLTQEEKEAKVIEGDEFTQIEEANS